MKPNKARSILKQLYHKVDREIDTMPKVCKKGCYFCCYQPVEVFTIEKVTLGEFIKDELSLEIQESIKEKTIKWLDFFDENTPNTEPLSTLEAYDKFRNKAKNIPFPCPLLFNGECSVYNVRPLPCRTHIVNDDKKLCEGDILRDGDQKAMDYRRSVVNELKNEATLEVIPLTYALVDILGIQRKTKKINKAIIK